MKNEEIINSILKSTNGMKRAEAPDHLYERIISGTGNTAQNTSNGWVFAAAASLILAVNIFCLVKWTPEDNNTQTASETTDSYELVQQITYNY